MAGNLLNGISKFQHDFSLKKLSTICSPQAKVGRQKDFEIALQRLRGKNADVFTEAEEIKV
jgi:hypothetical protein